MIFFLILIIFVLVVSFLVFRFTLYRNLCMCKIKKSRKPYYCLTFTFMKLAFVKLYLNTFHISQNYMFGEFSIKNFAANIVSIYSIRPLLRVVPIMNNSTIFRNEWVIKLFKYLQILCL